MSDEKGFPAHLKRHVIGTSWGCDACQHRFMVDELSPNNGKKSRTWILGALTWGTKEPCYAEAFIVKCPGCGNPIQAIIISQKKRVAELNKLAKPEELLPPVKKSDVAELPHATPRVDPFEVIPARRPFTPPKEPPKEPLTHRPLRRIRETGEGDK